MKLDINDELIPFSTNRGKRHRNYDRNSEDYTPDRRSRNLSSREEYYDEEHLPPYGQRERTYRTPRRHIIPPVGQKGNAASFRTPSSDSSTFPPVPERYTRNDEDEGYEDYGELGSNFKPSDDPSWGHDNFDRYDYDYSSGEDYGLEDTAPDSIDFSNPRNFGNGRNSNNELSQYLEYIDKYDRGEIDNHDMSRVQRRFENSSFWDTFQPSEKMIREYGSGNESTKWPLFERKNGRWTPINWRND